MVKLEGDVMTEEQKAGDVTVVITRQVVGGELVSVRIYFKILILRSTFK